LGKATFNVSVQAQSQNGPQIGRWSAQITAAVRCGSRISGARRSQNTRITHRPS